MLKGAVSFNSIFLFEFEKIFYKKEISKQKDSFTFNPMKKKFGKRILALQNSNTKKILFQRV